MDSTTPTLPAARLASRSTYLPVRGLRYHIREWGEPGAPILFLFHGWMDVSASFQFLVEALRERWHVVAPDWRGYGLTAWATDAPGVDSYWFADYLADLEAIVDHYQPDGQVTLVGHSLGANVVCLYAGVRPERVRRVVDLEGFGMPPSRPSQAARRYARWLDELKDEPRLITYATLDDVAARLQKTNPRLPADKAAFLARHWSRQNADGRWEILGDPAHKIVNPQLYRLDEVMEIWRRVAAPVLHVEAVDSPTLIALAGDVPLPEFRSRFAAFPDFREALIADAGHMLHHDQPEQVAALVEAFCKAA